MLEFLNWSARKASDLQTWLEEKELDAAVRRIKNLSRLSRHYANSIACLEKEKEEVEQKYFGSSIED